MRLILALLITTVLCSCALSKEEPPKRCLFHGEIRPEGDEIFLPERCEACACKNGSWHCVTTDCSANKTTSGAIPASPKVAEEFENIIPDIPIDDGTAP